MTGRHSFELIKSLELLSCILGWQWSLKVIITDNIWRILETWATKASDIELNCSTERTAPTASSINEQTVTVKADDGNSEGRNSTCCCLTSIHDSVSQNLPGQEELKGGEGRASDQGGDGGRGHEICSKCGKLRKQRLEESHIVVCIQLLGEFTRKLLEFSWFIFFGKHQDIKPHCSGEMSNMNNFFELLKPICLIHDAFYKQIPMQMV